MSWTRVRKLRRLNNRCENKIEVKQGVWGNRMPLLRRVSDEHRRSIAHWAMELLIVVAGVLIALWLQQWDERRRALEGMRSAETAVHDEVRATLESLIWREAIRSCHRERAQLLYSRLLDGNSRW